MYMRRFENLYKLRARQLQHCVIWISLAAIATEGCSSAGYRKGDAAANSIQAAAAEVQAESQAIDLTVGSLKDLVNEPGVDLRRPYRQFSKNLAHLTAAAQRTEDTGKKMSERSQEYFNMWDKQLSTIDYEHIRNLGQARKVEVTRRFEAIHQRYQESQQVVQPLISYLQDIHTALGSDLTLSGLNSMKQVVQNADTNAAKVQVALKALAAELTDSGTQLSSLAQQNREPSP